MHRQIDNMHVCECKCLCLIVHTKKTVTLPKISLLNANGKKHDFFLNIGTDLLKLKI